MSAIFATLSPTAHSLYWTHSSIPSRFYLFTISNPSRFPKSLPCPHNLLFYFPRKTQIVVSSKSSELSSSAEDEWLSKLPDQKRPLFSHSLPCIEAWLKDLGFYQSKDDRAIWLIEKPEWHAQLSLEVTELHIRYLKSGPGNLDKDVERRFSYALSREDIENAIIGGP